MSFCPGKYVGDGESVKDPGLTWIHTHLSGRVDFSDRILGSNQRLGSYLIFGAAEEIFISLIPHGVVKLPQRIDTFCHPQGRSGLGGTFFVVHCQGATPVGCQAAPKELIPANRGLGVEGS